MARIPEAVSRQPSIRQPGLGSPGQQFRGGTVDASGIGRGLRAVGEGVGAIETATFRQEQRDRSAQEKQEDFETQRRFIEFQTQQTRALRDARRDAEGGAFGFAQGAQSEYEKAARKFFETVPDRLKGQYDVNLQRTESDLLLKADTFEADRREKFYVSGIDSGLTELREQLLEGDLSYDEAIAEGARLVDSADISDLQKQQYAQAWQRDAAAAQWRREYGSDPAAAAAALGGGTEQQRINYQRDKLSAAVTKHESAGNPNAVSPVGATGLMQVMPETAGDIAKEINDPNFPHDGTRAEKQEYLKDPAVNVQYGEYYLNKMLGMFKGDVEAALIAYNAGPGNAKKWLEAGRDYGALPKRSETEPYVARILGEMGGTPTVQGVESDPYRFATEGVADPRYEALDFDTRQKLISDANSRIAELNKEQANSLIDDFTLQMQVDPLSVSEEQILTAPGLDNGQRASLLAKRDSQIASAQTEASESYKLALATDPTTVSREQILDDAMLDDGQKATLLKARETAIKEYGQKQNDIELFAQGVQGNSLNTDDRKSVDNAWKTFNLTAEDDNYGLSALAVVQKRGILPGPVLDDTRGALLRGDVEQSVAFLDIASGANDLNPQSLAGRSGSQDVRNAVAEYNHFKQLGYTPEQAAGKVIAARQPGAEQVKIPKDVQKTIDKIGANDIENLYDETFTDFFSEDPGIGPAIAERTILGEYRSILEEEYRLTGDVETARARADEQMKRIYNVSNVTGKPVIMRYPPEAYYPAFNGDQSYIGEQLKADVTSAYGEDVEGFDLVPVPGVTDVDVRMGRAPRYGVVIEKADGTLDVLPEGVFFQPDPTAGQERAEADRATQIAERKTGFENAALDGSGLVTDDGAVLINTKGEVRGRKAIPGATVNVDTREIYKRNEETGKFEPTGEFYQGKKLTKMDGSEWNVFDSQPVQNAAQRRSDKIRETITGLPRGEPLGGAFFGRTGE